MKRTETKAKGEEITKSGGVGAGKNVKFGHRDIYMAVCSAGRSETTYFDRARGRTETKAKGEKITKSGGVGAGKNVNFILRNFLTKIIEAPPAAELEGVAKSIPNWTCR